MLREAKQGDGWVMPPMEVLVEGDTEAASLANWKFGLLIFPDWSGHY